MTTPTPVHPITHAFLDCFGGLLLDYLMGRVTTPEDTMGGLASVMRDLSTDESELLRTELVANFSAFVAVRKASGFSDRCEFTVVATPDTESGPGRHKVTLVFYPLGKAVAGRGAWKQV